MWDINADESIAMQYSRRNYNVTDFHTSGPWAASDHDPALVGITFPGTSTPQPSGTPSVEPSASVSSQPSGEPSVSPSGAVSDEPSATASVTPGTPAPSLTPVPSLPGGTPGTPSATPAGASASAHGTGTDDVSGDAAQAAVVPGGSADLPALPATGI